MRALEGDKMRVKKDSKKHGQGARRLRVHDEGATPAPAARGRISGRIFALRSANPVENQQAHFVVPDRRLSTTPGGAIIYGVSHPA